MFERESVVAELHRQLRIEIPGRPPTPNVRRHWRTIARDNAEWKGTASVVAAAAKREWERRHGMRWHPLEDAVVGVVFIVGTKAVRDWDNLIATLKPLLDGAVEAGILLDDSNRVIRSLGPFTIEYEHRETGVVLLISEPVE
jgi:hypothetical protein